MLRMIGMSSGPAPRIERIEYEYARFEGVDGRGWQVDGAGHEVRSSDLAEALLEFRRRCYAALSTRAYPPDAVTFVRVDDPARAGWPHPFGAGPLDIKVIDDPMQPSIVNDLQTAVEAAQQATLVAFPPDAPPPRRSRGRRG